jgi:hypothetical protein
MNLNPSPSLYPSLYLYLSLSHTIFLLSAGTSMQYVWRKRMLVVERPSLDGVARRPVGKTLPSKQNLRNGLLMGKLPNRESLLAMLDSEIRPHAPRPRSDARLVRRALAVFARFSLLCRRWAARVRVFVLLCLFMQMVFRFGLFFFSFCFGTEVCC